MRERELRENFERDGFVVVRGAYDAAHVARLEREVDRIVAQLRTSGEDVNARLVLRGWNHRATRSNANRV